MRLFAALLPPEQATAPLVSAVHRLRAMPGADRLRWTERVGWHFTLAFYGEVDEDTARELGERLARAAGRAAPLRLELRGGGRFGDRALWAGVQGDRVPMRRLAQSVHAAGRRSGLPPEVQPHRFHAHLTLARARPGRPVDLRPYVTALDDVAGPPWTAGELTLIRSGLPVSGVRGELPRYETVAAWPLGG